MPTLMLFGHGAILDQSTFDFRRTAPNASTIYFWAAAERPSRVYSDVMASIIDHGGAIPLGWYEQRSSRIGGALVTDHLLQDATLAPDLIPWLPGNFATLGHQTANPALGGVIHHDGATVAASNVMVFMVNAGGNAVRLSTILANGNFSNRPMNIAWLVCRV